jgi:hypothetical protein
MLQLLCTYDPQLSQGLTVDKKRASLHDTKILIMLVPEPGGHDQRIIRQVDVHTMDGCVLS